METCDAFLPRMPDGLQAGSLPWDAGSFSDRRSVVSDGGVVLSSGEGRYLCTRLFSFIKNLNFKGGKPRSRREAGGVCLQDAGIIEQNCTHVELLERFLDDGNTDAQLMFDLLRGDLGDLLGHKQLKKSPQGRTRCSIRAKPLEFTGRGRDNHQVPDGRAVRQPALLILQTFLLQFLQVGCGCELGKHFALCNESRVTLGMGRLDQRDAFEWEAEAIKEQLEAPIDANLCSFCQKAPLLKALDLEDDPGGDIGQPVLASSDHPCHSMIQFMEMNPAVLDRARLALLDRCPLWPPDGIFRQEPEATKEHEPGEHRGITHLAVNQDQDEDHDEHVPYDPGQEGQRLGKGNGAKKRSQVLEQLRERHAEDLLTKLQ